MAGSPVAAAACRAFSSAFDRKVLPVSSGAITPSEAWLTGAKESPSSSAWNSRSFPGLPVAMTSRLGGACSLLGLMQSGDALRGEIQELVQLVAPERMTFRGTLHLDEAAAGVHHYVHVGLSAGVLGIVQVEDGDSAIDAHGDGGHLAVDGIRRERAPFHEDVDGIRQGDEGAGDRGGARAPVRL